MLRPEEFFVAHILTCVMFIFAFDSNFFSCLSLSHHEREIFLFFLFYRKMNFTLCGKEMLFFLKIFLNLAQVF